MFNRDFSFLETETLEFSEELFQKELRWLKRKEEGKVIITRTPGSWKFVIGTALLAAFFIGGSVGSLLGVFFNQPAILYGSVILTLFGTLVLYNRTYSTIELDVEDRCMKYHGQVVFGGETRSVKYHGPIEVINATQIVKHSLFSKYYVRFVTKSGYLRVSYNPSKEMEILEAFELVGLFNFDEVTEAVKNKNTLRQSNEWNILYELQFDRSEFIQEYQAQKERDNEEAELLKQEEREKRIARSKQRIKRAKARGGTASEDTQNFDDETP